MTTEFKTHPSETGGTTSKTRSDRLPVQPVVFLLGIIVVHGNIVDVSGSKNRFQYERPCKNLGEVRSLVHELNIASASKRNFVIDKILADVEVRLRRTFHLIWLPPSCAHLR